MLEKKKKFTTSLSTVSIILYALFTFFNSHLKYKMNDVYEQYTKYTNKCVIMNIR